MFQVLSLGLGDGPGIGWSERVLCYASLSLQMMGNWVNKCPLVMRKLDNGVGIATHQCSILGVNNAGCFSRGVQLSRFFILTTL